MQKWPRHSPTSERYHLVWFMWTSWQSRLVDGGRLGSVRHTVVKTHFYQWDFWTDLWRTQPCFSSTSLNWLKRWETLSQRESVNVRVSADPDLESELLWASPSWLRWLHSPPVSQSEIIELWSECGFSPFRIEVSAAAWAVGGTHFEAVFLLSLFPQLFFTALTHWGLIQSLF